MLVQVQVLENIDVFADVLAPEHLGWIGLVILLVVGGGWKDTVPLKLEVSPQARDSLKSFTMSGCWDDMLLHYWSNGNFLKHPGCGHTMTCYMFTLKGTGGQTLKGNCMFSLDRVGGKAYMFMTFYDMVWVSMSMTMTDDNISSLNRTHLQKRKSILQGNREGHAMPCICLNLCGGHAMHCHFLVYFLKCSVCELSFFSPELMLVGND